MKKIFSRAALCMGFMLFAGGAAHANPYTFEFEMPAWNYSGDSSLYGTASVLRITADNGAGSTVSQTYMNSQITGMSVQAVGGSYTNSWDLAGLNPSYVHLGGNAALQSYLTTDQSGIPTLNLLASSNDSNYDVLLFSDENSYIQLGIVGAYGGSTTYAIVEFDPFSLAWTLGPSTASPLTGFAVTGVLVDEQSVPEPASLALIGLGLAGAGAIRRRKQKAAL